MKHKDLKKEELLHVKTKRAKKQDTKTNVKKEKFSVPTDKIISPQMCLDITESLTQNKAIRTYIGGVSYENRKIPTKNSMTAISAGLCDGSPI